MCLPGWHVLWERSAGNGCNKCYSAMQITKSPRVTTKGSRRRGAVWGLRIGDAETASSHNPNVFFVSSIFIHLHTLCFSTSSDNTRCEFCLEIHLGHQRLASLKYQLKAKLLHFRSDFLAPSATSTAACRSAFRSAMPPVRRIKPPWLNCWNKGILIHG